MATTIFRVYLKDGRSFQMLDMEGHGLKHARWSARVRFGKDRVRKVEKA